MSGRRRLVLFAALVALAATAGSRPRIPLSSSKLDRALVDLAQRPSRAAVDVLIQVRPGAASRVLARLDRFASRGRRARSSDLLLATVPSAALAALAADPDVTDISSNAAVRSLSSNLLSGNTLLETEGLLATRQGGQTVRGVPYTGLGIGVALIDSGIRNSGDLNDILFFDFTNGGTPAPPADDYGHGTHVAGLIASSGRLSRGQYAGLAPGVHIVALKVLDATGAGLTSDVIDAIDFAVANRRLLDIDVINLSLGHPIYEPAASDPLVQAVEHAVAAGIVVVTSAGNFGGDPETRTPGYAGITSPGNAPSAITVGALDTNQTGVRDDDTVAWYSSRGPTWHDGFQKPDLVAPGSKLVSDLSVPSTLASSYPGGIVMVGSRPFMRLSGTSMSAGVVSGVVALMLDANRAAHRFGPPLAPNAVKAILEYTSFAMPGYDTLTEGAGALNAAGAVALASAIDPGAAPGSWWLGSGVNPATAIDGATTAWGQSVVWGDRVIWGNQIYTNDPAWGERVVWGDRVVWGNLAEETTAPMCLVWGQLEISNRELMRK